ncbi:ABC transporter permease [Anaerococcus sp. mt242]|uniref:ABC transporter permease n=1 Tax=Anaerococcus sp. mt242 TaxID=2661917 RepID=UPI0019328B29|nr:ABC transporter permease [Anaerococcus sp. mt242]MBM0046643.1 ABC transporter permease [Anaerococcus sp. mt242]
MNKIKPYLKMEMIALSREYVSLFFMIVLPMVLTIVFGGTFGDEVTKYGPDVLGIDTVIPVNIVFLLANTGLMGIPITTLEAKDQGVLKRYMTYPVSYGMYFLSLMLTFMIVCLLSTSLFVAASFLIYDASWFMDIKSLLIFIVAYFDIMFVFFILGYALALLIKSTRTASLVASGVFMFLIFTSGVALPVDSLPEIVQKVARVFPMYHSIEIVQNVWINEFSLSNNGINCLYMLGYTIIAILVLKNVRIKWD